MKKLFAIPLLLLLCGIARAQNGNSPHPGIGICPTGQLVSGLVANGPPRCTSAGAGSGTVTNVPQNTNGPAITSNTTTPNIVMPTNTWFAQNFSGATMAEQVQSCVTAADATNGTCDATGIQGNQSWDETVVLPTNTNLLLGNVNITNTVCPAITAAGFDDIEGVSRVQGNHHAYTTFNVSGVSGCAGVITGPVGGTSGYQSIQVSNLQLIGISESDGSIGIAATQWSNSTITNNNILNFQTGIVQGGGTNPGAFYNLTAYNFIGATGSGHTSAIGFSYGTNANDEVSILDQVHINGVAAAFQITAAGGINNFISPDVEASGNGSTIGFDISGFGNHIDNFECEATGTCIQFESTAVNNQVTGGGNATSVNTGVNYVSGASLCQNYVYWMGLGGGGGTPYYPQCIGTNSITMGGNNSNFFTWAADTLAGSTLELGATYTPGSASEVSNGHTGHAPIKAGGLVTTGGLNITGSIATTQISTPPTPVCTATCEPSDTANCASPATTYEYAIVGHDYNTYSLTAGSTTKSATSNTCANSSTLITAAAQKAACVGSGNPIGCCTGAGTGTCVGELNTVTWAKSSVDGILKWDIVGNQDLVHSVATNQQVNIPGSVATPGANYSYVDTNNSPSAYTPPSRNSTADANVIGGLTVGSAPTGADEGAGTVNAKAGYYNNGSLIAGVGTTSIAGGGALATGSNSFAGQVTSSASTGNVVTLGFACPDKTVPILGDETHPGVAGVTATATNSFTFSATASDVVDYIVSCR